MGKKLFVVVLLLMSHSLFGATRLLVVAPGEVFTGGSAKTGASLQQTAGSPFYVTVYACDSSWNIDTSEPGFVTMTSSDATAVLPATQGFTLGKAILTIILKKSGSGTQTITAVHSGSATPGSSTIPVTFGALDHFNLNQNIASKTAGQLFTINAAAVDMYDNTVTTFSSYPTIGCYNGNVLLGPMYSFTAGSSFTNGVGSIFARIYQRVINNASVKLTYAGASGTTNVFDVAAGSFTKLLFVAPGQTYDPGNNYLGGVNNNPSQVIAGSAITITVYTTDDWGNMIGGIYDSVSLTTSDSAGTINGAVPPENITLSGGQGNFNITFQTGGIISVTGTDTATSGINDASVSIEVQAAGLSYFEAANVPVSSIAGQSFSPVVRAKDRYGNTKTDFAGIVYLSANTDYTLPFESTMAVTDVNTGAYYNNWAVTFTASDAGNRMLTGYFYRAATYTARIFASDNFNDTQDTHTGHFGISGSCSVGNSSAVKMQVLAPGMEARPGTADGGNNTPYAQTVNVPVTCTVNITDNWWNVVQGRFDQAGITTNDPINSQINGTNYLPTGVFLSNGTNTFTAWYSLPTSAFRLQVVNLSVGGITGNWSPDMTFYTATPAVTPVVNMSQISITGPAGATITAKTAGVPFTVVITVYSSPGVIDTGFNGTVEIGANTDYSSSEFTVSPTISVNFSAGIATMQVTIYRAQSNVILYAKSGARAGTSNIFDLLPGPATGVLVLADGIVHKPGLRQTGLPGYKGYYGSPKTVEAGYGARLEVMYVDDNYNRCYSQPVGYCKITSSDPLASLDGTALAANNVYVTITAGSFVSAAGMVLRRSGVTGQQYITADPGGSMSNNTTPPINVRHTLFGKLGVSAPIGPVTAGIPVIVTVTAMDAYNNICDDMNGGTPFNSLVNLTANTGPNTMWPYTCALTKGITAASVRLFKAPQIGARITAENAGIDGTSSDIMTVPDVFKRLLVIGQGMERQNGVFTSIPPSGFMMYNALKPPYTPSNMITVNDLYHNPGGESFIVYSCDLYGNITATADAFGRTVTAAANDAYAAPITATAIDTVTGQAQFKIILHTAKTGVSVTASIAMAGIENFTTPAFTTLDGTPYGLQILLPGFSSQDGSGYYDVYSSKWYNGVTGTAQVKLSGEPFSVTVRACDIYGNFSNYVTDRIRVTAGADTPSFPSISNFFEGNLYDADAGLSTLTAHFNVSAPQYVSMHAEDLMSNDMNIAWLSYPYVYVSDVGAPTATLTPTSTQTATITATNIQTQTGTATSTQTPSLTRSQTQTATCTFTQALTGTATATLTVTAEQTASDTPVATAGSTIYAYPQPAANSVNFVFSLEEAAEATVEVYNVSGTLVARVTGSGQASQANKITLNTTSFAPGVYYYMIKAKGSGGKDIKFRANKFLVAK